MKWPVIIAILWWFWYNAYFNFHSGRSEYAVICLELLESVEELKRSLRSCKTRNCFSFLMRNCVMTDSCSLTLLCTTDVLQESCAIAKMAAQCALHMGAPKIFGTAWLRPRPLFPTFSWAFVPIDSMNVPTKFEVRSFTRSWDNRGYPKKLGSPWIRPRSLFSKIFNGFLFW